MENQKNKKHLIIAGCSYYWKVNKELYPDNIPEAFLKEYQIHDIGLSSSSIEYIKESIIHTIGELLSNGIKASDIYLLSNLTNIGRFFIKYPENIINNLSDYYKKTNRIGKYVTSSLILTYTNDYKPNEVKVWERRVISNIENSRLPIQNFEIYLENVVILQSFLKTNNISHTLFLMNNIFEGWSEDFNHVYSNLKGPVVPDLSKNLHIKDMSEYCKYLWDLIDLDSFVFHKTIGNNYGGIDEYAIDKFKDNESLYFSNPKKNDYWYGNHPNAIVYSNFSNDYKISDKIINNLK